MWVTSHHRGAYVEREHFLRDLAAFAAKIDERERTLLGWLKERPMTLDEMVARRLLYPAHIQEVWVDDAERRTIELHLAEMAAAGSVAIDQGMWRAT